MIILAVTWKIVWNMQMTENKKYEIDVSIRTMYLPDQSDVDAERYVFAYTIKISNTGDIASQQVVGAH